MAGLYAIIGNSTHERITKAAERLTFFPEEYTQIIRELGIAIAWVSHDDPSLFGPVYDPQTGARVITSGRIAWDEPDWQRAEGLNQYSGGLSNRLILDQYLTGGVAAIERHNGSAALLVWDPRQQLLHLFTDHFGFHPLFLYRPQVVEGCVISTFPDAIADDEAVETTPDYVSMAEFLREWKATPPHTYYNEIKYAGAASHWCWNLAERTCDQREYWRPFQAGWPANLQVAVEQLADAVSNAIRIRTLPRLGPIISYSSGGLDSRTVLFSAADCSCLYGVNLYDLPNREASVTKQLCEAAGVKYIGFARDDDYYPYWIREGVRLSGAMWSAEDNHFLGTRDLIEQLGARTVLTGCPADIMFKGADLEKSYQQILGRKLPFFEFSNEREDGFLQEYPQRQSPPEFATEIELRMKTWFGDTPLHLASEEDRLKVEDKRIRPGCYQPAAVGQMMFRIFPYDVFMADRAIADCYSRTPAQWKLNATLWELMVVQICSRSLIDANFGWQPGASSVKKLLIYTRNWLRKKLELIITTKKQSLATEGSWPDLGWYITHSKTLREMWEGTSVADRQLISVLWGSDPWSVALVDWTNPPVPHAKGMIHGNSPYAFFRILTLLNYWAVRRR